MPAKTTKPSEDMDNLYGYSDMEWAAQLDPAYAAARAEVRCLSVGDDGTLSVKAKEFVVMGVLASRGLQYGLAGANNRKCNILHYPALAPGGPKCPRKKTLDEKGTRRVTFIPFQYYFYTCQILQRWSYDTYHRRHQRRIGQDDARHSPRRPAIDERARRAPNRRRRAGQRHGFHPAAAATDERGTRLYRDPDARG